MKTPTYCNSNTAYLTDDEKAERERRATNPKKKCLDCDSMICLTSTRCVKCTGKKTRAHIRPSLAQLLEELESRTYVEVGKLHDVSDNTIKDWIRDYGGVPPPRKHLNGSRPSAGPFNAFVVPKPPALGPKPQAPDPKQSSPVPKPFASDPKP